MYYPYFRGKQYELITIREMAPLMAKMGFVSVIEPVKEALSGMHRTLKEVCDAKGEATVIVNPYHGDHKQNGDSISELLKAEYSNFPGISVGILLKADTSVDEAAELCQDHAKHPITLIHAGFTEAKSLKAVLGKQGNSVLHIFNEHYCRKLYRINFAGAKFVLLRDGFKRQQRNRDYPPVDPFSDLHVTYKSEGAIGFGDFLAVGDDYSESGGPAYAVAIHLTFIDADQDDMMNIYHFVSDSQDTPTDTAGKFSEALQKLIAKLNSGKSHIFESSAITEFRRLHKEGHFPGLGYVKKLSMKHHIETLADYLG